MPQKLSRREFDKKLKERPFENLELLNSFDKILKEQRGYIYKFPKAGEDAILMVSGGIDSIVAWGWLMEEFKLKIHPVFFTSGKYRQKKEERAVDFFAKIFEKKYPDLFNKPTKYSISLFPPELKQTTIESIHPEAILKNLSSEKGASGSFSYKSKINLETKIIPFLFPFYGVVLSTRLKDEQNLDVKNIFLGVGANDGIITPTQSFTSLRGAMVTMCAATSSNQWNFCSPFLERQLGSWMGKAEIIKLGKKLNLPLENAWSCYFSYHYQCGNSCQACKDRVGSFIGAKVVDKTDYLFHQPWYVQKLEKLLFKLKKSNLLTVS